MDTTRVRDVMTNLVLTARPEEKITQVAKRLVANRISGAPVVRAGRLVGIVSEADLMKICAIPRGCASPLAAEPNKPVGTATVAEVMKTKVVSINPDATIWEAASLINRHSVRRLPVVDEDGFVVGVVARADLVRYMAQREEASKRYAAAQ